MKLMPNQRKHCLPLASLFICVACGPSACSGQSFLEKLEQAVRKQTEPQNKSEGTTDQLPRPKSADDNSSTGKPITPPPRPAPAAPSENPSNSLPSIIEPDTRESQSTPPPPRGGKSYLGLEAEENVGGGIGVRVVACTQGSPAWKAGFEIGDRVLAINGYGIANLKDMVEQLGKTSPGETVHFLISRGGRNKELAAVLMDADLANRIDPSVEPSLGSTAPPYLGVMVNDLTTSFRRQFGINVYRGAAVSSVSQGSPASQAGIQAGDAIIEAGGVPIESADALMSWVRSTRPGQKVELLVYRGSIPRTIQLVMGIQPRSKDAAPTRTRLPTPRDGALPSGSLAPLPSVEPSRNGGEVGQLQALVSKLQAENQDLSNKLKATSKQLAETEAKLEQIMRLLKKQ